jgi:hypothetical protein
MELASAAIQMQRMGSPAAKREVAQILADARKRVYRLLSEDEPAESEAPEATTPDAPPSPAGPTAD